MKMNLSAKGRKLLGAFGLGRSDRGERRVTDPDGGSAQCAATLGVGFSKSDEIMNTKTNTLWCKSLAMLALTFALAGPALGQTNIEIDWSNPADILYGTILDGTQLNAVAKDANGNVVDGTYRYSWTPPTPPAQARDGEDNPAVDGVTLGIRSLTLNEILNADADSTVNGVQANPDWRFLDVGDGQDLRVDFTPASGGGNVPFKVVEINVKKKPLTIFPQALERNFGEENYPGWETGKTPTYPNGNNLFDGNGTLVAGVASNLLKSDGSNATRGGQNVQITGVNPDAGNGYAFTGQGLFFDGFARGETYQKLTAQDPTVAAANEVLVTQLPRLNVKNGNNDVFRGAPVGTTGTVTFAQVPAFKNYAVSVGGSGSLTVKKATIRFEAAELKDGNSKIFGETLALTEVVNNKTRAKQSILKTNISPLPLNNDFRLGEAEILDFITPSTGGAAATAAAGTYTIVLTETPPQTFDVSILRNNYDLQLVNGSLTVKARDIQLTSVPSNPPGNFDPRNISGFNFKLYGDSVQAPTFTVSNPAAHHLINGAVTYDDPRDGIGNPIANTYHISQLKGEAFDALPTVTHTVQLNSVPGFYDIDISGGDGQGSNYNITARTKGNFEVRRAYLVIQAGNASSFVGGAQAAPPISLFGVRSFDIVNNADGTMNVDSTLNNILIPGTPRPSLTVTGFNNNPGGNQFPVNFPIVFNNKNVVRAANYDVYFNDANGASNFLDNGTRVAVNANGGPSFDANNAPFNGRAFSSFLGNIFEAAVDGGGFSDTTANPNPPNPQGEPAHALFTASGTEIGKYSVDVIRASVDWATPPTQAFGTDIADGRLNATFLHPDTRLPLQDNRNIPPLTPGVDFVTSYELDPDGNPAPVIIKSNDPAFPVPNGGLGLQETRLLKAGKTHKLTVRMQLTAAGIQKVGANNEARFEPAPTSRNLVVVARSIKITPRENGGPDAGKADNPFGVGIPANGLANLNPQSAAGFWKFDFDNLGSLTQAQLDAEIKFNDVKIQVLDSSGAAFPVGKTDVPRGSYTLRVSGLAAQNGNVSFNLVDGSYTVTPIPVVIAWENNLPTITYGDTVPVAGVKDATITTANVPAADGSIVYTPDPETSTLTPDFPSLAIKAKWVPNDPATSNFSASNEITRNVGVNRKAITVAVANIDKTFGDATPDRTLVTPINTLLAPIDAGKVLVNFDVEGNGADAKAQVGEYSVSPNFVDNQNRLANYAVTIQNARIKVNKRTVTVTPVSRSMEVGLNATDFVDNWEIGSNSPGSDANRKPNDIAIFANLASFHDLKNNRGRFDTAFGGQGFELSSNSPSLPSVGQTFNINIQSIGALGGTLDGVPVSAANYNFTLNNGVATLSVVEKKVDLTFNDTTITYGQKIGRSGKARGDNGTTALNDIKALDATSTTPLDGSIKYTFAKAATIKRPTPRSFAAGDEVPDGIILPAGAYEINATATPAAGQTNFAPNTVKKTITVNPRPLTIAIQDRTNTYGDLDLFFQANYGIRNNDGVLNTPDQLVNGDTPAKLERQLVLFSNANATSGAGEYYIAVGQSAKDPNYAINQVVGSQQLSDGRITDPANNAIVLVNVGVNTNGDGAAFGFTRSATGAFETSAGKFTVDKAPLTIGAADLSKDQGQANPPIQAIIPDETQLKNGDTLETLLATPVRFSTSVGVNTAPGTYDIFSFGGSSANYVITHVNGTFTVLAKPAPIGWNPNPSALVYGTALGAEQLNATSTIAGTFDYSANPAGTVLGAGVRTLTATFTPTDLAANRVTTATATIEITPAPLTVTANDITRAFSAPNPDFTVGFSGFVNGDGPAVITSPITFATDGVAGANAGAYPLTPGGGAAANYDISFVPGTINITKENATITLANLNQVADGTPRMVSVTTVPEGVNVGVTYNGRANAPTESGTYEIRAIANDPNYNGFAIGTLTVSGTGVVTISNLTRTFTGSGLGATITTDPVGLGTQVTYNGSPNLPVNAGTYEVRVIIDDPVFSGFGVDVLTIQPAEAEISFDLDSLSQPVNGLTGAVVNTVPAGLTTEIFYGDSTTIPNEIGSTLVRGVINEPNWVGSVTSTFRVENATQSVTVPNLPEFEIEGDPVRIGLFATASSQLPVTFSVVSGSATVRNRTLTVTQPGDVVVLASQAGDDFWAPAEATFTVTVTGQGVPQAAPSLRVAGISNAGIEIAVTGGAGATVNIMGTDILPGGTFSSVGTVTLDGSGNGSLTVPVSGSAGYFKAANQ